MAEKKKRPSAARPRALTPTDDTVVAAAEMSAPVAAATPAPNPAQTTTHLNAAAAKRLTPSKRWSKCTAPLIQ